MEFNKTRWSCPWNSDKTLPAGGVRGVGVLGSVGRVLGLLGGGSGGSRGDDEKIFLVLG